MKFTRRSFIKTTGAGVIASGLPAFAFGAHTDNSENTSDSFRLAIAGYTFAKINLDQSLVMMKRVGAGLLGVKDFHLPLDSTKEVIDQTLVKMKSFGVEPYGVGPIYMKTEASVDQAFIYAKLVGVNLLVGVPDIILLPYAEKKVKEYNIRLAIHNHGPDLQLIPALMMSGKKYRTSIQELVSASILHIQRGSDSIPLKPLSNIKHVYSICIFGISINLKKWAGALKRVVV